MADGTFLNRPLLLLELDRPLDRSVQAFARQLPSLRAVGLLVVELWPVLSTLVGLLRRM